MSGHLLSAWPRVWAWPCARSQRHSGGCRLRAYLLLAYPALIVRFTLGTRGAHSGWALESRSSFCHETALNIAQGQRTGVPSSDLLDDLQAKSVARFVLIQAHKPLQDRIDRLGRHGVGQWSGL